MSDLARRTLLQTPAVLLAPLHSLAAAPGPYRYAVSEGSFEITNGPREFNRPLPPSRSRDAVSRQERLVTFAGDKPRFRFTSLATRALPLAELAVSINGKPAHEFASIQARYNSGRYDYQLTDPSIPGSVTLSVVPLTRLEGAVFRLDSAEPAEVRFHFTRQPDPASKRVLHEAATGRFFFVTSDDPQSEEVRRSIANPAQAFDTSWADLQAVAGVLRLRTPDPYLDALLAQQNIAIDRAWHHYAMMHGVYSWHVAMAGWRILYGPTVLGLHDRVRTHARSFFAEQVLEPELPPPPPAEQKFGEAPAFRGAIPGYLGRKSYFYNMGEVLCDMVAYDWLWSGDLDFARECFDPIARKLEWQDRVLDPDNDGLYENWLNAWNTDSKWHNGGGGIISSVYTWRTSVFMADLARRIGRDPQPFLARAERIRRACDRVLWLPAKGVYAEFKDALGLQRLHEAPDQSSIYTPIDLGFCDDFQSYQMLRFAETDVPAIDGLPRGGRLLWSSNWLPQIYSTHGLYADETVNLILCYFRLGLAEKGYALLKGLTGTAFMGDCPGSLNLTQRPDGSSGGHMDFTDIVSVFLKTVVDGLFGVRMNAPDGVLDIQPAFPPDWDHAAMDGPVCSIQYSRSGAVETLIASTPRQLRYRFRVPARKASVKTVTVDGSAAAFRIEPGVGSAWIIVETDLRRTASLRIEYGDAPLPQLTAAPIGSAGERFEISVANAVIAEIRDPQRIALSPEIKAGRASVQLGSQTGWHTFFVLAKTPDLSLWLPVDVEIRPAREIIQVSRSGQTISGRQRHSGRTFSIPKPDLTPGANRFQHEGVPGFLEDWSIPLGDLEARPVSLAKHRNQRLVDLHNQRYISPRTPRYTMTVEENGRSWWLNRQKKPDPRVELTRNGKGLFISKPGIPFEIPAEGPDACFVSLFDNFPKSISIPIGQRVRKIYFLIAASTNQMQSRIQNAGLSATSFGQPNRGWHKPLVNPDNLDDWLMPPFASRGCSQPLGPGTWARILDMEFETPQEISMVSLDCLSNEVLVGLIGLTIIPGGSK